MNAVKVHKVEFFPILLRVSYWKIIFAHFCHGILRLEMGKNLKSMVLVRFGFLYGQGSVRFWFLLSCCLKSSGSVRVLPINGSGSGSVLGSASWFNTYKHNMALR
jgi:hypothetical protein